MPASAATSMNPHPPVASFWELGRLRGWAVEQAHALLEPVLHPSPWRMRAIAALILLGNPLFYFIWSKWLPQPYENAGLRLAMASLGLVLLLSPGIAQDPPPRRVAILYSVVLWVALPVFFTWMYLCNEGNAVWLASMGAMLLIYYHLTDWRLATIGSLTGTALAWVLHSVISPHDPAIAGKLAVTNAVVISFCWSMGITLGLSAANMRREHLAHTLTTIGIMAHELRTPLATAHLIAESMRHAESEPDRMQKLSGRLESVVRVMNHQIDTEIANARLTRLEPGTERVAAGDLVRGAIEGYPFRTARERASVTVAVHKDFEFIGRSAFFVQVVTNLTKNALRALAASQKEPKSLVIEVDQVGGCGVLRFRDNGIGISPDVKSRLFQPFVSTAKSAGHGLGLAFCKRAVQSAGGTMRVESTPGEGATFLIDLPLA